MSTPTLFVNARIHTLDPERPLAEALAVEAGRLIGVGRADEVAGLAPGAPRVDLGGQTVIPGFVDAHNHFAIAALEGFWADCRTPPATTIAELQRTLAAAARTTPAGEWVRGLGYHHTRLAERRHPTRHDLDEAIPDRPALLLHFSHHQGVANSRALQAAGITRAAADPPGGEIGRDKAGEPDGLLYERALSLCERASREGWEARFVDMAAAASRRHAALGITTLQDAAVSPAMEARYQAAERAGALLIRVLRMATSPTGWFEPPWELARTPGEGRWLKLFADGGHRCAMRLRRDGRTVDRGFLFYRRDELADLLVAAWRSGWRVACHAIGNRGIETGVGAIEDALRREPAGEGRVRMDHAMFLTAELIARIRALGIWLVGQPSFLHDLGGTAQGLDAGLLLRPFRTIRDAGIPQAFSSDAPCGSVAPLLGLHAAVTRLDRSGAPCDPDEALPVQAALAAYTLGAARAGGLEAECGSLTAGKRADFLVLSGDPLATPAPDLLGLSVLRTYVAGRPVHPAA